MKKKITIKEMDEQDFKTQVFQAYTEMGYKDIGMPTDVPVFVDQLVKILFYSMYGNDENK